MRELQSLPHFAASTMAPMFEVFEVYDNTSHPFHVGFLADLNSIPYDELQQYILSGRVKHLIRESRDADLQYKLFYMVDEVSNRISILRKDLLLNFNEKPEPYTHPELSLTPYDKNFLVNASDFSFYIGGFKKETEVFTILPSTDATNSSYWLVEALYSPELRGKLKLRLDPLIHQNADQFNPMMYKMQVYGRLLDWGRIKKLQEPEQIEFLPEFPSSRDILKTEIIWSPINKEIHFTCEELPKDELLLYRGSRYFHAIIERYSGKVIHCDGAIRYYNEDEFANRLTKHIKSNEVTRVGKRIKVFQVDGEISQQCLINLITSFFVWNHDVLDYFN